MSAYASLPGSFLPPFFSFGLSSSSSTEEGDSCDQKTEDSSVSKNDVVLSASSATTEKKHKLTAALSGRSYGDPNVSAFRSLSLSPASSTASLSKDVMCTHDVDEQQPSSSSASQSDIDISIRNARIDPVQLIKSLTSKGSSIARRTANYVAASVPGASSSQAAKSETAEDEETDETSLQSPSFCMTEHTDCSESGDDMSFYDYDDDFSATNSQDDEEDDDTQQQSLEEKSPKDDPAAIQFELAISFQGRKYTATRAFSTFVKLRNDLLRESGDGADGTHVGGGNRRLRHHHRTHKNSKSNLVEVGNTKDNDGASPSSSVPELPTVSPENANAGHGGFAITGFARSGFALLQATAKLYCPEMEKWLRHVVDTFPYSPSLSQFLWEPLASSSASWDTENNIAEEEGEEEEGEDAVVTEKNASYVGSKPPLHSNSKSRSSSSPRKTSRFTQSYSCGSLNSIEEVQNEFDRSEEEEW
eukprot:CAMPEP_0201718580 /NCGR_PEP_ID=MMETSP0593-20130828/4058_1 /ASSEMBLY_ACC=CAM_ASM_000672 /TAXON_ID=267983 /ORGANISM="Skeletonema japonicum, Strain CCMP2506" /LENGTH=473 /DNA_ID=CAMNT_0048208905 /DNA_START=18 /DNA_END=1439 /DNA_ORIENTATION=-